MHEHSDEQKTSRLQIWLILLAPWTMLLMEKYRRTALMTLGFAIGGAMMFTLFGFFATLSRYYKGEMSQIKMWSEVGPLGALFIAGILLLIFSYRLYKKNRYALEITAILLTFTFGIMYLMAWLQNTGRLPT